MQFHLALTRPIIRDIPRLHVTSGVIFSRRAEAGDANNQLRKCEINKYTYLDPENKLESDSGVANILES